jgi:hypothetical protein
MSKPTAAERAERLLHQAHLRYQRQELAKLRDSVAGLPYAELRGVAVQASASMKAMREHASKMSASYYKLFCDHDVPRWMPCKTSLCKRGDVECATFVAKMKAGKVL